MIEIIQRHIIPAAYAVLPKAMASREATAMLLSIGLQESKFLYRKQEPRKTGGEPGPARGFWQFERGGGVLGVMTHAKTRKPLGNALAELRYARAMDDAHALHSLIEHNDVVAAVLARLLLWTVPHALPLNGEANRGWSQYLNGWRPGEPHPSTWNNYFVEAWARVDRMENL